MELEQFLNPKTVAVIGATDNPEKVGYSIMRNLFRFKGRVIPINLNRDKVMRLQAYKSVLNYKKKIDLAIIAIPREFVAKALVKCGKKSIKNVIVISSGFSEVKKVKEEGELVKIAKRYKINLLGPNCFGVANPSINLNSTFAREMPNKGNIAFISQSGALWSYISDYLKDRIGFSGFVSLGNMAQLGFHDLIDYFSKDEKTKAIVLYVEKIKNGEAFLDAAQNCKKPIYVVKAGRSEEGRKAAISHTGSLATDYNIYKGIFRQAQVELCKSLLQCFEKATKKKLSKPSQRTKIPKKVTIITNAGGAGALLSDSLAEQGIEITGPIDLLGTAKAKDYEREIKKHIREDLIIILTPQTMTEIQETANIVVDNKGKRRIITYFLGNQSMKQACKILNKAGIPCLNTLKTS